MLLFLVFIWHLVIEENIVIRAKLAGIKKNPIAPLLGVYYTVDNQAYGEKEIQQIQRKLKMLPRNHVEMVLIIKKI
jgi:hypothetical protein